MPIPGAYSASITCHAPNHIIMTSGRTHYWHSKGNMWCIKQRRRALDGDEAEASFLRRMLGSQVVEGFDPR